MSTASLQSARTLRVPGAALCGALAIATARAMPAVPPVAEPLQDEARRAAALPREPTLAGEVLRPGATIRGEVRADSPELRSPALERAGSHGTLRGETLRALLPAGTTTIELEGHLIQAYLIVTDESGAVLAENDDGPIGAHSRVVIEELAAERRVLVHAAARGGTFGPFELTATAGAPPPLDPVEQLRQDAEDARECLAACAQAGRDVSATVHSARGRLAYWHYTRGEHAEAERIYREDLTAIEPLLGPDHPETIATVTNLSAQLLRLGRIAELVPLLERSLAWRERHADAATPLPQEFEALISALRRLGRRAEAHAVAARGLEYVRSRGLRDEGALRLLSWRAILAGELGRTGEQVEHSAQAMALAEELSGKDSPAHLHFCSNHISALTHSGESAAAQLLAERTLAALEAQAKPEPEQVARVRRQLGTILFEQHKLAEARAIFEQLLASDERRLGPGDPDLAKSLTNLGAIELTAGDPSAAAARYESALAILESAGLTEGQEFVNLLANLAVSEQASGRLDDAARHLDQVLERIGTTHGPMSDLAMNCRYNRAFIAHEAGDLPAARRGFEELVGLRADMRGSDDPETLRAVRSLVRVLLELGERDAALALSADAFARLRRQVARRARAGTESDAHLLVRTQAVGIEEHLSLLRAAGGADRVRLGYEAVLGWKGIAAAELRARRVAVRDQLAPTVRADVERLQSVQAELSSALSAAGPSAGLASDAAIAGLRRERNELETRIARSVDATPGLAAPDFASLAAALPEGVVLIDFFSWSAAPATEAAPGRVRLAFDYDHPHLHAWVTRRGAREPVEIDLGETRELHAAVEAFLDQAVRERGAAAAATATADEPAAARRLRERLWAPLEPHVAGATRLVISPDAQLALLPFGIVVDAAGRHLLERFEIVNADHAGQLLETADGTAVAARAQDAAPSLLVAGAVDYDAVQDAEPAEDGAGGDDALESDAAAVRGDARAVDLRGGFARVWNPLSETRREIDGIARLHRRRFAGAPRVELREDEASEERLKEELPGSTVVHLATHGYFLADGLRSLAEAFDDPQQRAALESGARALAAADWPALLCGLVCAGANEPLPGRDNGLLTGEEASGLELRGCELVVLSACESGLGRAAGAGQGSMSLARAFRDAGARTVIASLWRVRDDSTRELMLDFYERLWNQGASKLEALRGAQLAMLQRNRQKYGDALPHTWGAFVLTGDAQ